MSAADFPFDPDAELGLRERKKRATRIALQRAALELVSEGGIENVTVEAITARVGVSPRTFFNYFATKEDAFIGADPERLEEFVALLHGRPTDEPPLESVRRLLLAGAPRIEAAQEMWRLRLRLAPDHPEIFHAAVSATARFDSAIAQALAERAGVDMNSSRMPRLVTGVATAVRRTAIHLWANEDFSRPYPEILEECFDELKNLLPTAMP